MKDPRPYPRLTKLALKVIQRATGEQLRAVYSTHYHRKLPADVARRRLEALAEIDPARVLELLPGIDVVDKPVKGKDPT